MNLMRKLRQIVLVLGDVCLAYLALFLTVVFGFWGNFSWQIFWQHFLPFSFLYLFWFIIFFIFGLYDLNLIRPKTEFLGRIGQAFLLCLGLGIAFFYIIPFFGITPKVNLLINIIIFAALISVWRRYFYHLFSSFYLQNIAFLGENHLAKVLVKEIESQPHLGYKFVKFLDPKKSLFSQLKSKKIDSLIIAQDITSQPKLIQELYKCLPLKINFMDLSQAYELFFYKVPVDFLSQSWFLKNLREGEKKIYDNIKRIEDIIFGSLIITLTSPLWLIFSILIKLEDKGPVFYKQERVGKDKKVILLWKFRSMKTDSEKRGEPRWAEVKDPRVTRIGRFLRRSHLDEVPQMLNVLKGDISLAGPRPERPEFVKKLEKEIPHYHLRHIIKPGFTGWGQIKFRYARTIMDSHEKFQYDLYYIKNRSFFLDLGILLKTFQLFFKSD